MTLIDEKKGITTKVLGQVKSFVINTIISLALYMLIFTIGSITLFACNVSEANMFVVACNGIKNISTPREVEINIIKDDNIIENYLEGKNINVDKSSVKSISQILEPPTPNNLLFCVRDEDNKYFGIFKNSVKNTINFIYYMILWYTKFLYSNIADGYILWFSPFFSFLFFSFILFISGFYFAYKVIENSCKNMFNNIITKFANITITDIIFRIVEVIISFWWIILLLLFGIGIIPIITYFLVLYAVFCILTQKFRKKEFENTSNTKYNYGIFQKMADNLIYKRGFNIIIILIICVLNIFLLDAIVAVIILILLIIFYFIFYKNLNVDGMTLSNFYPSKIKK